MFDALKTQGKFNPYMVGLPVIAALSAWQLSLVAAGWAQLGYETIKNKQNQK
jgi:hypothetical protein